jgi:DNA-binding beta-propeller fold protein YncE
MRLSCLAIALITALPLTLAAQSAQLARIGGYDSGIGEGGVEIVAFDAQSRRAFVVNGADSSFDILDLANPQSPVLIQRINTGALGVPNSVAVGNGMVAVALEAAVKQDPGRVAFYSTAGALLGSVTVGALPDMVSFSPDGRYVLSANEGEPNDAYTVDPEGSVSIIDLAGGVGAATVSTVRFVDFNVGGPRAAELPAAVRIFGPGASVAQDLEPEYIAITPDSRTAFVSLQENNALAVIDIPSRSVTRILALGFKDHSLAGNAFDPSDRDGPSNTRAISIRNFPVFGMYQPDAIAVTVDGSGRPLVFTANEGDARDYDGFSEEVRAGSGSYVLDPVIFPNAATLKQNANLGRLNVTRATGNLDGDAEFERIHSFGARSFSVFDGQSGALVFDSGSEFETITAALHPTLFNSEEGDPGEFDARSDNKGPEPESVVLGDVGGRQYAFIGLERIGGAFVYDATTPTLPNYLGYSLSQGPDQSPEGLVYVRPSESPNGRALVLIAHEVSGTLGVYELDTCTVSAVRLANPDQILITGYCPSGLDVYCTRQGVSSQVASGVPVNTEAAVTTPLRFGDRCFAALQGGQQPINGITGALDFAPIPTLSRDGLVIASALMLLLGLLTLSRRPD